MADKVFVTVAFDRQADRDILRWLEAQENRSAAIREALRAYLGRGGVTLADLYQAIKDLERLIRFGVVVAAAPASSPDEPEEPPDLAAALDALGKL